MISLNPDNVRFVIERLGELEAQDAIETPESDPGSPSEDAASAASIRAADGLEAELRATLEDLEPDQQQELTALLWLGRGDFTLEDWDRALREARELPAESVAELLLETPLAATYLAEGLDLHDHAAP